MRANRLELAGLALMVAVASSAGMAADTSTVGSAKIKHVLLLSIDGMHAVDFYNCAHGIPGVNGGYTYCPNMAGLSQTGVMCGYAGSPKPWDWFPGMAA